MGPCGSDKDCKLDRICDAGSCVWAQGGIPLGAPGPRPAPPVPVRPGQKAASPLPLPQYAIEPAQAMFRFGPAHRGRSPYVLPSARPSIWWTFSTGGPVTSSPAIAEDGALLFGSHDGKLYAISRDGSIKWQHATGDIIFSSPAVTHDGTIYIGSDDDHLYAIGPKSDKPRWVFQVGSCPQRVGVGPEASRCDVDAGPTIGPDGVIYTGGDGIYAINPDGTLRWRFATNGHVASAPALLADGTVVAGSQDDLIYAIAPGGFKRWDFRTGGDVDSSPSVGDDGTIYVGSDDHKLYALNPDGTLRWAFNTGGDLRASPALGNGVVYIGSFDAQLYAIRTDGTLYWTFRTGDRIVSSALVDSKGAIALRVAGRPRLRPRARRPAALVGRARRRRRQLTDPGRRRHDLRRRRRPQTVRAPRRNQRQPLTSTVACLTHVHAGPAPVAFALTSSPHLLFSCRLPIDQRIFV